MRFTRNIIWSIAVTIVSLIIRPMKKAVIFDMDGVLIDSEPIYMYHTMLFFQQFGISLEEKEVRKLAGSSNAHGWEMMASWWKEAITPNEMKAFYEENEPKEAFLYSDIANPYVKYVLNRLRKDSFQLAIASSSPMAAITDMVEDCQLNGYFDLLVTGMDFAASKPNPEIYLSTMERLKVTPEETIVVEDSHYGIEAGKKAGATVIALKDERFYPDQSESDYVVNDLLEAYLLIQKLKE